jgi:hypothetical protein
VSRAVGCKAFDMRTAQSCAAAEDTDASLGLQPVTQGCSSLVMHLVLYVLQARQLDKHFQHARSLGELGILL